MHFDRGPLQLLRALPARRPSLVWLLALIVFLKAAVPLLAAASARERGVSLAEVCSVYGVRTVAPEQGLDTPKPAQSEHAGSEHCALTPLLGTAVHASPPVAAVRLHAPAKARLQRPAEPLAQSNASFDWLVARTHAPPLPV
jgi:hypothetical protein